MNGFLGLCNVLFDHFAIVSQLLELIFKTVLDSFLKKDDGLSVWHEFSV